MLCDVMVIQHAAAELPNYAKRRNFAHCMQYVDALRCGKIHHFKDIEAESGDWWFPTLDRGSGSCLHFAVDHGQVRLLLLLSLHDGLPNLSFLSFSKCKFGLRLGGHSLIITDTLCHPL